jgi:hypothetical protein
MADVGTGAAWPSIGQCFRDATDAYTRNFWPMLGAAVVFELLLVLSLGVLGGPLYGGICRMSLRAIDRPGERVRFADLFGAFDRFMPLLGLFYLTVVPILAGYALLIVPGVLLGAIWLYPFYLMIEADAGVIESLRGSWRMARRSLRTHVALSVITTALCLVPTFVPFVGYVIAWLVAPLVYLIVASAYRQLAPPDLAPVTPGIV